MTTYWLKFFLLSDAAFGRGDGVAGVVDAEVQHDEYGLPYLGGKTLKGLLGAMGDEILFALSQAAPAKLDTWQQSKDKLFGTPGSGLSEIGILRVGDAQLPADLRAAIAYDVRETNTLTREEVLVIFTDLRRQTAMDTISGAPQNETLRTVRVILRETPFESRLEFAEEPSKTELAFLAACVRAFRRAGSNRNRGLGRLIAELYDRYPGEDPTTGQPITPITDTHFDLLQREVQP